MNLLKFCKDQISQYLLGSSVMMTAGQSGSYSSANAGLDILEDIVDSDTAYCEFWLDWLLYYQSVIFGFNYKDYNVKLEKRPNAQQEQAINTLKLDNYTKIKGLGFELSIEYLSEQTGIPVEALKEAEQVQMFEKKNYRNF